MTQEEWDALDIDELDKVQEAIDAYFFSIRDKCGKPTTDFERKAWDAAQSNFDNLLAELKKGSICLVGSPRRPAKGVGVTKRVSSILRTIIKTVIKAALPNRYLLVDTWEVNAALSSAFLYGEYVGGQRATGSMSFESLLSAAEEIKTR